MMVVERIEKPNWHQIEQHPHAMLSHSRVWWEFLRETQGAELVVLRLVNNASESFFVGGIIKKFGIRILGSPFPGWTTSYTGLLGPVNRLEGLSAIACYAFEKMGIFHFECLDGNLTPKDINERAMSHRIFQNFLLDLTVSPEKLQNGLAKNAKGSLSAARQRGVQIMLNPPDQEFAAVYYRQLLVAFARQGLRPSYSQKRVESLLEFLRPSDNVCTGWSRDESGAILATNISIGNQNRASLWGATLDRSFARLQPTELLQWEIIKSWQARGTRAFDFGGAGEYKRKYGGIRIETPFVRFSRYPVLERLRGFAFSVQQWKQRQGVESLLGEESEGD